MILVTLNLKFGPTPCGKAQVPQHIFAQAPRGINGIGVSTYMNAASAVYNSPWLALVRLCRGTKPPQGVPPT